MRNSPLWILCFAAACTGDVSAPDADALSASFGRAADPPLVPFRLSVVDGTAIGAPGGRCGDFPMITVNIQAVATATHLGRTAVSQSHCQNAFDVTGAFTDGEFTDTGADGSTIFGTYEGFLIPTADPTLFTIAGEFAITGGTRRFAGATGGGTASGTVNAITGASTLDLVGLISSVGSLR